MRKILGLASVLVLLCLVALTLARFLTTGLRWPILLAAFSSYALPGFVLVLAGCALVARRARRRGLLGLVATVAVLGLVVQVWAVAPLFIGGAAGRPDLTVMTANLEFGRGDAVSVVRTVAAERVDVLVLEEVTPVAEQRLSTAGLTELLPHQAGTPVDSAAGTMVFSRYRLGTDHGLSLGNGGLDVDVGAPQPFRLLAVHTAQPVTAPRPWLADLDTVRDRAAAGVERGPDDRGGGLQRVPGPPAPAGNSRRGAARRGRAGGVGVAAHLAHPLERELDEAVRRPRPRAREPGVRRVAHPDGRGAADGPPRPGGTAADSSLRKGQ